MMAECALLIGKPRDAAALLEQLDKDSGADKKPPPVGSQQPADGGGSPLRLSLLAAAWQCAGELMKAAAVSSRGVASAGKLATSPVETCVFWMRRGHLLLALNRPVDAVAAYATAAKAEPHSLAANEALLWARHLAGLDKDGQGQDGGGLGQGVMASRGGSLHRSRYEKLVKNWPTSVRARSTVHVRWRDGDLMLAIEQLTPIIESTQTTQPSIHATALTLRAFASL